MSRSHFTHLLALVAAASALAATGCGSDDAGGAGGPTVVATTGFAADLARGVAGEDAAVVQLVPDSANPHTYSASAKDRATLEDADLIVAFGRNYEEGLPLDEVDAPQVAVAEEVGELRTFEEGEVAEVGEEHAEPEGRHAEEANGEHAGEEGEHAEEEHAGEEGEHAGEEHADEAEHAHEHAAGSRDPHVWLDPMRMAAAAPRLAGRLTDADPGNADAYRERAGEYAREMRALDAELEERLAGVAPDQRKLVTSHDSMGYFAERYGFDFVGAPFGLSPEAEASSRDIAEVIDLVREEQVPAVFSQQGDDPEVMRQIATEADVEVVDDLLIENPGPQGETYAEAMRHNAERIVAALGG